MAEINLWFPTTIYTEENILTTEEHKELLDHVENIKQTIPSGGTEWFGSIYTSFGTYDIIDDPKFSTLIDKINFHVHEYTKQHNSNATYECTEAWFNESVEHQFQEFHTHANNIVSAVYYLQAPEGSGDIVFRDPKAPDMYPLKDITQQNDLTFGATSYAPTENSLIIFRSYLEHMVKAGKNKQRRISIALNYR
jgi:uncharacterized protein (TIGR02466 family)